MDAHDVDGLIDQVDGMIGDIDDELSS